MRRAGFVLPLVALLLVPTLARVARGAPTNSFVNAVAYLDYTGRPTFKVGDWIKYEVTTYDATGAQTDHHQLTVLISGEKLLWGERCFYLESWTDRGNQTLGAVATLISYSVFDDSLGSDHRKLYQRVLVTPPTGRSTLPTQRLMRPSSLKDRDLADVPVAAHTDTVGVDTVQTGHGIVSTTKLVIRQSYGNTNGVGDSTIYRERHEERTRWRSLDVPITHFARETETIDQTKKAWFVGRSGEGKKSVVESAGMVTMRAIDWGTGLKSRILPPELSVGLATPVRKARAATPAAPRPRRRS